MERFNCIFLENRYFHVVMLITKAVYVDKSTVKVQFCPFNCPTILLHILTDETLLFNWDAVLGCQLMYL